MMLRSDKQASCTAAVFMSVGAIALMGGTDVLAQEAANSQPARAEAAAALEEITVTAQKMGAQSILEVPLTISALDAHVLESAGVQGLGDIGHLNPSVNFVESLGRSFNYLSMRGISSTEGGTPTVQVYVDGFTTGIARSQLNTTLFNLERVEILEGPQATLYGRNAIGGVINYVTKKPGNDLEAELRATGADYGQADVMGRIAGPLVPGTLFADVAVSHHERDGYLDNVFDGEKGVDSQRDNSGRLALRTSFGNTTIDLSGTYTELRDGCGDCSYVPRDFTIPLIAGAPPYDTSLRDGRVNLDSYDRTINQDTPSYLDVDSRVAVLNIEHDFGWAVLTSISGYGKVATDIAFSLNRAAGRNPNDAFNTYVITKLTDRSWSEELRFSGGSEQTLRWLVGGYYSRIEQDGSTYFGGLPDPLGENHYSSDNTAAFVNLELPIGERFVLGGGVRYDREKVKDVNPLFALAGSASSDEVLPRITASYRFDSGLMPYVTVSKGYKSGGVNVGSPDPSVPRTFAPEYLWNYEAGLKGRLFGGYGIFTLSAFHMDWSDRQVQLLDPSGVFVYQANLGRARIDGVETQVNVDINANFQVDAGVTFLDAGIERYIDASGVSAFYGISPDLAGNELPNAPRLRVTLSPQWTMPVFGGAFDLRARADVSYTGERYFDAQNLLEQDAYTLVNLNLGLVRDGLELGVFANNAFNEGYHSAGSLSAGVGPLLTTGAPRVVGARIVVKMN